MFIPVVLLGLGALIFISLGALILHVANKPSTQSTEYLNWLRSDRAVTRSVNQSWKEGNWS